MHSVTSAFLGIYFNPSVCIFFFFLDKWSPALQIRTVLLSIQALLSAPNPDDPLANDVAEQWKSSEADAIEIGESCDLAGFKGGSVTLSTQLLTKYEQKTKLCIQFTLYLSN